MEEQKKERTIEVVTTEFQQMAFKSGQIQYQIYAMQKDLEVVNKQLLDLNLEAAVLKGKEEGKKS